MRMQVPAIVLVTVFLSLSSAAEEGFSQNPKKIESSPCHLCLNFADYQDNPGRMTYKNTQATDEFNYTAGKQLFEFNTKRRGEVEFRLLLDSKTEGISR